MFFRALKVLMFFFLMLTINAQGQIKSIINHYSTSDGLADNRIRCIIKDSEGFMWFGSWAGISRFDGHNFVNFKSYPGDMSSLKSNRIIEIVDDKAGFLWLRAYDNQIYRFDKSRQQFLAISNLLNGHGAKTVHFVKILNAGKEVVWLKSKSHGLFMISNPAKEKPSVTQFSKGSKSDFRLPSDDILFFYSNEAESAWVGTSKGLVLFRKQKDGSYKSSLANQSDNLVYTNAAGNQNNIWFTTVQGYLVKYDSRFNKFSKYKISASALNNLLVSENIKVYCTTNSGQVITVDANGIKKEAVQLSNGSPLYSVYEDQTGLLWVEPEKKGIYKYNSLTKELKYFFQENLTNYLHSPEDYKVYEDNSARVWTYMKGCGFGYYNPEKDEIEYFHNDPRNSYSRFSNAVTALYYDNTGVLWLSTDSRGLEKIVFQSNDFKQNILVKNSLYQADNEVRSVLTDKRNRLWLGTKAGELYLLKDGKRLDNFILNKPLTKHGIYCIYEDRKGRVWLGTKDNGLYKAEPVNSTATLYKITHYTKDAGHPNSLNTNTIYTILEDKRGRIWAGSYEDGLILLEETNGRIAFKTNKNFFKNYPKGNYNKIRHMAEDKDGNIWVATTEGLVIFNPNVERSQGYNFFIYKKKPKDITSLGGDDVQYVYKDSRDIMWVCTSSGGLNKAFTTDISKEVKFKNYSTKDGLPSDYILNCYEDMQDNLWIATQNGISKFIIKAEKFQNIGLYEGLTEIDFSEGANTRMKNGELVFGSTSGYWTFNPKKIGAKKISTNLALTNFRVNNNDIVPGEDLILKQSINNTSGIKLQYNENTFSIDFAVLDYRLGEKDDYIYRLVGFQDNWQVNKGQRRVTYTNLSPGKYVFEVQSQTDYLYNKVPQRTLAISIIPPPWKTWWAYVGYMLMLIVTFLIIRKFALDMLSLRHRIAVERNVADLKTNFFTQISHELRTPLTLIVSPAEEILKNENLTKTGIDYINVVIKNSRRMVRFVNQLLDLRKVQSGKTALKVQEVEIITFIKDGIGYFKELIEKRQLTVLVESQLRELWVWLDVDKIDIVLYNLLSNAIKFSPDNSKIVINIKQGLNKEFTIDMVDEGPGITESELTEIFKLYYEGENRPENFSKGTGIGLALTKELVELHSGKIYAINNLPQGLKVILQLKLGKEHYNIENTQFINSPPVHNENSLIQDIFASDEELPKTKPSAEVPSIVLVEDNDDLRAFLMSKLSEHFNVNTARDGEEGLRKAKEFVPDLILSDIMMPKMDGIQLLDALKNDIVTSHIPVVLLTAKTSIESQIEALEYGADYYIGKPFSVDLLQTVISSLIIQRGKLFKALLTGKKITDAVSGNITAYDQKFLEKVIKIVEERLVDTNFNIDDVSESIGMSRSAFFKKFKSLTNLAPVEFVRETRLTRAKEMFDSGEENVSTVAYSIGFNNPKYFSTCFKAQFNQTPTEYIKQLKNSLDTL